MTSPNLSLTDADLPILTIGRHVYPTLHQKLVQAVRVFVCIFVRVFISIYPKYSLSNLMSSSSAKRSASAPHLHPRQKLTPATVRGVAWHGTVGRTYGTWYR